MRGWSISIALLVFLSGCWSLPNPTIETVEETPRERQLVVIVDEACQETGTPIDRTSFRLRVVVLPKGSSLALAERRSKSYVRVGEASGGLEYEEVRLTAELTREVRLISVVPQCRAAKLVLLEPDELRVLRTAEEGIMVKARVLDWDPAEHIGRMDFECVWGRGAAAIAVRREGLVFRLGTPVVVDQGQLQPKTPDWVTPMDFYEGLGK